MDDYELCHCRKDLEMSKTGWKKMELEAASLLHGARYPANTGGSVDVESAQVVAQVKNVRVFSLARMEVEAEAIARVGNAKNKTGIVMVKRSAGKGTTTPWLVVMTAGTFRELLDRPQEAP